MKKEQIDGQWWNLIIKETTDVYLEFLIKDFYRQSLSILESEDVDEQDFEMIYAIGYNHFNVQRFEEAFRVFEKLVRIAPKKDHYWTALALTNFELKNYKSAIKAIEHSIELNKQKADNYIFKGECLVLSRKKKEAKKWLKSFIAKEDMEFMLSPAIWTAKLILEVISNKSEQIFTNEI